MKVKSSALAEVNKIDDSKFDVVFHDGSVYTVDAEPGVYDNLVNASSVGRVWNTEVRNTYTITQKDA